MKMGKGNTKILVIIIVILAVALIGSGSYLMYTNTVLDTNKTQEANNQEKEGSDKNSEIEFDEAYVNEQLNKYIGYFLQYKLDTSSYDKNLFDTNALRGDFINAIFMINENFTWYHGENVPTFPYVATNTYQEEYKKVYGDYYSMEEDSQEGATFYKSREGSVAYNALGSTDFIVWNGPWENKKQNCTLNATKITYDAKKKEYQMTGTYQITPLDSSISETGTFSILYSLDDQENAAMKSLVCNP